MNLKGFNWYDDNNKRIMSYDLKTCTAWLYADVTKEDALNFNRYLITNGFKVLKLDKGGHEII